MAVSTRRGRRAPASRPASHSRLWIIAGVAVAALAVIAALVAIQASGSDSATLPPRIAEGEGRMLGDPNAPVTIVEYADFQCPICKRAETSVISQIEKDYIVRGKVNLDFRMFPFLGQESFSAAQAAEAADAQGKFWEYHDALFNAQGAENSGAFSRDRLVALAQQVGLDVPRFEADLDAQTYLPSVQEEAAAARSAGVHSTPTFFINGKQIVGAQPYAQFKSAIDAALAAAGVQ